LHTLMAAVEAAHNDESTQLRAQIDKLTHEVAELEKEGDSASAAAERHAATICELTEQKRRSRTSARN
jgi:hypothetical protein